MSKIQNTIEVGAAADKCWDFVVVGAGLSGACLARLLAKRGREVLLIDKCKFPRSKTCGGTLNTRSVEYLKMMGLEKSLTDIGSRSIEGVEWRTKNSKSSEVFFQRDKQALAVSRFELDAELIRQASNCGVEFLQDTRAISTVECNDHIKLLTKNNNEQISIVSECVIACDGLGSALARQADLSVPVQKKGNDYIGTSIVCDAWKNSNIPENRILMVVGEEGYTGVVKVEQNRINIAAAIRLDKINHSIHPATCALRILHDANIQLPTELQETTQWDCTKPVLKRKVTSPCKSRLLLAGDALGYVEPVTGEGMSWALESVLNLNQLLANGWSPSVAENWKGGWLKFNSRQKRLVRLAGLIVRSPKAMNLAINLMRAYPRSGYMIGHILDKQNVTN